VTGCTAATRGWASLLAARTPACKTTLEGSNIRMESFPIKAVVRAIKD
jgi:hypothetical protein